MAALAAKPQLRSLVGAWGRSGAADAGAAVLRAYASILFSRSLRVGAILIVATATAPRGLLGGLLGAMLALAVARAIGIDRDAVNDGSYAVSPILLGLGIAQWFGLGPLGLLLLWVFVPISVLVTAALRSALIPARMPVLSLPFLFSFHLLLGLALAASLPYAAVDAAPGPTWATALSTRLPVSLLLLLRSVGALFFIPRADAGALILLALTLHSRIATLLACCALVISLLLRAYVPPLADETLFHSLVYNAAFVAVALGGVWFVPSAASFMLALFSVALAALLTLGAAAPLARIGLPVLILPFNVTVFCVLLAMRQRARDLHPKSVDFAAGTPEQNLAYYRTRTARFRAPHPVKFQLPIRGTWICTQGVDGPLTHQGPWRHAFDFEVYGQDGRPVHCSGDPTLPSDYRAFRLPVLATAAGTVVQIENNLPDNPIGTVNVDKNWGNFVLLSHGPALYSLVAHLAQGSVRVAVGQSVRVGEQLGLCGNSGRSPEPHIHFQLQGSAQLGSPTLPCRFSDGVVLAEGPQAHDRIIADLCPQVGQWVRNLEPDAERAGFFQFPYGTQWILRIADRSETIESLIDLYGSLHLRSHEHAASLYYTADGQFFTAYDLTAPPSSVLHLVRAALSRVPCDAAEDLRWTDLLPARMFRGRLWGALLDVASPFFLHDSIEVEYHARRHGTNLLVVGRSRRCDRAGHPIVETEAELSRGSGLVRLRVAVQGRVTIAERVAPAAPLEISHAA